MLGVTNNSGCPDYPRLKIFVSMCDGSGQPYNHPSIVNSECREKLPSDDSLQSAEQKLDEKSCIVTMQESQSDCIPRSPSCDRLQEAALEEIPCLECFLSSGMGDAPDGNGGDVELTVAD